VKPRARDVIGASLLTIVLFALVAVIFVAVMFVAALGDRDTSPEPETSEVQGVALRQL
jgi:hypothetical protein